MAAENMSDLTASWFPYVRHASTNGGRRSCRRFGGGDVVCKDSRISGVEKRAISGGAAAATLWPYTVDQLMYALMEASYEL